MASIHLFFPLFLRPLVKRYTFTQTPVKPLLTLLPISPNHQLRPYPRKQTKSAPIQAIYIPANHTQVEQSPRFRRLSISKQHKKKETKGQGEMDYTPYDGQKMARKTLLITHQVNTKRCWFHKPKNQQIGYGSKKNSHSKPYKQLAEEKRTGRMLVLNLRNDTGFVGWSSRTGVRRCFFYE